MDDLRYRRKVEARRECQVNRVGGRGTCYGRFILRYRRKEEARLECQGRFLEARRVGMMLHLPLQEGGGRKCCTWH